MVAASNLSTVCESRAYEWHQLMTLDLPFSCLGRLGLAFHLL
jgi:hypothetical protein